MQDLISRQAAIDAIEKIFPANPMLNDYTQGITVGAALSAEYIKQLPPAHPGCDEWCTDCKEYDQQKHYCPRFCRVIKETVEELKSEQPEIIRCKDCEHFHYDMPYVIRGVPVLGHEVCDFWGSGCKTAEDGFCSYAERRPDERTD